MNAATPQPTEQQVRKGAADVLSYTFFHLVKELRSAEVQGTPKDMPTPIKAILNSALFGAITELMSIFRNEDWSAEWEQSS
ncbi:hypothetical protein LP414_13240 [Polaromonas sp. P1(28)-13]|nr:hypothetical protein LP414_13240 [Polaromonas sp. P1(28)-13]